MKYVIVDLGADLNIIPSTTWEKLARPKLVKKLMNICLVDDSRIDSMCTWKNVQVNIKEIKQYVYFEVVEMNKPFNTFQGLFGLRWFMNSNDIVDS